MQLCRNLRRLPFGLRPSPSIPVAQSESGRGEQREPPFREIRSSGEELGVGEPLNAGSHVQRAAPGLDGRIPPDEVGPATGPVLGSRLGPEHDLRGPCIRVGLAGTNHGPGCRGWPRPPVRVRPRQYSPASMTVSIRVVLLLSAGSGECPVIARS